LHQNSILLVNFSKNIKYGISENMSDWSHALSHEERWTDGKQMGRLVIAARKCFAKAPKH
jgi:hypothetical protein